MRIAGPRLAVAAACLAALLATAPAASAHQSAKSNGITVTMHIAPDDEPVAGQPAALIFVSAKRPGWTLRRSSCGCRFRITDASGASVLDRRFTGRAVTFTFPRSGAYRVSLSGRLQRGRRSRSFDASFTYRAS